MLLHYCNKTANTATSGASGSIKYGFVESVSLKTCEQHNTDLRCSKHYVYYYSHFHYTSVSSISVKGATIVSEFSI